MMVVLFRYITFGSFRLRFFSTFFLLSFITLDCVWFISVTFLFCFPFVTFFTLRCVWLGSVSFNYFTFGSFWVCFFSSFLSLCSVTLECVRLGSVSLCYVWFCFITFCYVHGTHRHIKVFSLSSPQSLSLTYTSHRRPSYPFNPVLAHNITACGVCINTDEVLCSFIVICMPQADKITN